MKKHALTLAETLITLTIIGVVAAMTIPTLMSKYQEKALESQFKKSYSILNQAVAKLYYDYGYDCYYDEDTKSVNTQNCRDSILRNLVNYLKTVKSEKVNASSSLYKTFEKVLSEGGAAPNKNCTVTYSQTRGTKYYLVDGSTIYITTDNWYGYSSVLNFTLDVNGDKGPNKWGYDVFHLYPVRRHGGTIGVWDYMCPVWEKGGKRVYNLVTGSKEEPNPNTKWPY